MEQSLNLLAVERPRARIAFARLLQAIGWAGLCGLALLAMAAFVGQGAWTKRTELARALDAARGVNPSPMPTIEKAPEQVLLKLPKREEIPMLLTRIERAATESGLPWSAGDYRIVPASDRQPAVLEVRCAFKAPYPKLRAMLAQVIGSLPAVTFREMSFARPNVDSIDVDAKFTIAAFLVDDEATAGVPAGER